MMGLERLHSKWFCSIKVGAAEIGMLPKRSDDATATATCSHGRFSLHLEARFVAGSL